jgi:hypothetical protein
VILNEENTTYGPNPRNSGDTAGAEEKGTRLFQSSVAASLCLTTPGGALGVVEMGSTVQNLEKKDSKSGQTYYRVKIDGDWWSLWQKSVDFSEGDTIEYAEDGDDFIEVEDIHKNHNNGSDGENSRAENISKQVALKAAVRNTEEGAEPEEVTDIAEDFHRWLQKEVDVRG